MYQVVLPEKVPRRPQAEAMAGLNECLFMNVMKHNLNSKNRGPFQLLPSRKKLIRLELSCLAKWLLEMFCLVLSFCWILWVSLSLCLHVLPEKKTRNKTDSVLLYSIKLAKDICTLYLKRFCYLIDQNHNKYKLCVSFPTYIDYILPSVRKKVQKLNKISTT